MALRIEAEVRSRVEAALASPEVQARIEARLREERAALEQKARQGQGLGFLGVWQHAGAHNHSAPVQ